jgi:hypothetical protein
MNKPTLFENYENKWQEEWIDMPEFIQTKKDDSFYKITIRFKNEKDLNDFSKLINQKITNKTKSIWFPEIERGINANKLYINES